ncbi:MAG: glycosyltransferase [Vampirovibrionales bacterium]|nr:glycosyltransferase [Vampirovibrionales bacterium]
MARLTPTQHSPVTQSLIRDKAYQSTLRHDLRRQGIRRWVHQLASLYETLVWKPQWASQPLTETLPLSVCIITMNSADRIAPLLQYLRPYVAEIVVGVDSKTTDTTWQACEGLADELFTIENNAATCNGGLKALVDHCHQPWILRLDDDEFPEPHVWELLPGLIHQQRFTHYKLPRLHLTHAEADTLYWSPDGYLYPDFQMRLFKNDPTLLRFPEAVGHTSIGCAGKRGKINTVNLVHLNLAINPRHKREEKLAKYIQRHHGQWVHPINEHALLFEDFDHKEIVYTYSDKTFQALLRKTIAQQRLKFLS